MDNFEVPFKDPRVQEQTPVEIETKVREKRVELDDRIRTLCDRAISYEEKFGDDDFRTQILLMTLEVVLQMRDVVDLLNDVGIALQCIGQAIGCVDEAFNLQQSVLDATLNQKYGFKERRENRRKIKRAIKNNTNRMKQLIDTIVGVQSIGGTLIVNLRKTSVKMRKLSLKTSAKRGGKRTGGEFEYARKYIKDYKNGADPANPAEGGKGVDGGTGSTEAKGGASKGESASNIDDIV